MANSSAPTNALRTGFTAADVAANRRRQAAPEHERSLAQATSGYPVVTARDASAEETAAEDSPADTVMKSAPAETEANPEPATESAESVVETPAAGTTGEPAEGESAEPATGRDTDATAGAEPADAEATAEDTPKSDSQAEPEAAVPEAGVPAAEGAGEAAEAASGDERPAEVEKAETVETGPAGAETVEAAPAKTEPAAEDKTSVLSPAIRPAEEKTSVLAAPAEEKTSVLAAPAEEKTSVLAAPAEEKTSVLAAPAEEKTSVLAAPAEEKTSVLAAPAEEKTSVLMPATRPAGDDDKTSVVSMPPRRRIITGSEQETRVVGDVPGFSRPSRPAWTPMQLRPPARRGVTIFGTTLTRRQAAIGLGIVLTFVLLVGIILVQAFGTDDAGDKAITPGGVASAPAKTDGGASGKPPASAAPGSVAPSSPAPTRPTIPAGWRSYEGAGYRVWVPQEAQAENDGDVTLVWGQYGSRRFRVDIVPSGGDPAEYLRRDSSSSGAISLLDHQGVPAAERVYDRKNDQRALRRALVQGGKTYVLTWYAPPEEWDALKGDRDKILESFKVG